MLKVLKTGWRLGRFFLGPAQGSVDGALKCPWTAGKLRSGDDVEPR